jgi:hypothetical protein
MRKKVPPLRQAANAGPAPPRPANARPRNAALLPLSPVACAGPIL